MGKGAIVPRLEMGLTPSIRYQGVDGYPAALHLTPAREPWLTASRPATARRPAPTAGAVDQETAPSHMYFFCPNDPSALVKSQR